MGRNYPSNMTGEWVAAAIHLVLYEEFFWKSLSTRQNFPFGLKNDFHSLRRRCRLFHLVIFLRVASPKRYLPQVTWTELSLRPINASYEWNLSLSVTRPLHYQETKAVTAEQLTLNKGVSGGDDLNSCSSVKAGRRLLAENILLLKRKSTKKGRSH